jgi:hypothetical protein
MSLPLITVEVAKVLLTGYFTYMRDKGLNEQEIEELYQKTKLEFLQNDPANLEDI